MSLPKSLIVLVISIIISLLLGEVVVRMALKDKMVLFPRYHSAANYGDFTLRRLRPNATFWHTSIDGRWKFVTNAQGFRDERDFGYEKPPGRLRVLTLGDSHTEGFEVRQAQTYSAVVERFLRAKGVDAEVINTGVSGFSTAEELAFLENEGIHYKPDVVVLGFFANDFEDNIKAGIFKLNNGKLVTSKQVHIPGVKILNVINAIPPLRWLSENSYLYSLAFNTIWDIAKNHLLRNAEQGLVAEYAIPTKSVSNYEHELMSALIKRMFEFCKRNEIKLVIIDIPTMTRQTNFSSSVPADMIAIFRTNSHIFVSSEEILGPYHNLIELHVPHGHNHISEFSHAILGATVGSAILMKTTSNRKP